MRRHVLRRISCGCRLGGHFEVVTMRPVSIVASESQIVT